MKRRDRRMNRRQMATHHKPRRRTATNTDTDPGPTLLHETPPLHGANRLSAGTADATFEFGRVRVLSRQRQLLADGVPVELGTRAFELLLVLLEADGLLVPKGELLGRVWQGPRGVGREPQGSGLCIAQSAWRGPRCHPHGSRPRLPLHRPASLKFRSGRLSMFHASNAALWSCRVCSVSVAAPPGDLTYSDTGQLRSSRADQSRLAPCLSSRCSCS